VIPMYVECDYYVIVVLVVCVVVAQDLEFTIVKSRSGIDH